MKCNWVGFILAVLLLQGTRGGAVEIGLFNPYITDGARISPETLVPTLRKWYLPQALYSLYGWQGSAYTNYARDQYRRYVRTELEGDRYYDLSLGNYFTKGWNIYNFTNEYPRDFGSGIWKDPNFSQWFNRLIVVSGGQGAVPHLPDHRRGHSHHDDAADLLQTIVRRPAMGLPDR